MPRPDEPAGGAAEHCEGGVLYVLSYVPTYVHWEIRELARRGVGVIVVLPDPWPRAAMWERMTGGFGADRGRPAVRTADFHRWLSGPLRELARPSAALLSDMLRGRAARSLAARCLRQGDFRYFLAALWLRQVLRGERFARVHSHFATDPAHVGALLAHLAGVPFTVTTHAADIFLPRSRRRLQGVLRRAARVVTISRFNRDHLERTVPGIGARVRVLHLGIDVDALPSWSAGTGAFTIVCSASGLGEKKGVPVLLEACRLLQARGMSFQCCIMGADPSGQRVAALQRDVRERGLDGMVRAIGTVPWSEALQHVARAGVFVHPSVRTVAGDMDGIPVSLLEAMGIGAPVVASRLSGIPELVEHRRNGLLVAPGDALGLADAIADVAGDPALARAMGRRARNRVREGFSLSRAAEGLLEVWADGAPTDRQAVARSR